jgi:hypothetical protein
MSSLEFFNRSFDLNVFVFIIRVSFRFLFRLFFLFFSWYRFSGWLLRDFLGGRLLYLFLL